MIFNGWFMSGFYIATLMKNEVVLPLSVIRALSADKVDPIEKSTCDKGLNHSESEVEEN